MNLVIVVFMTLNALFLTYKIQLNHNGFEINTNRCVITSAEIENFGLDSIVKNTIKHLYYYPVIRLYRNKMLMVDCYPLVSTVYSIKLCVCTYKINIYIIYHHIIKLI